MLNKLEINCENFNGLTLRNYDDEVESRMRSRKEFLSNRVLYRK